MLQFDRATGRFQGGTIIVTARALCERVAALMAAGERPGCAFERLLDEREWLPGDVAPPAIAETHDDLPAIGSLLPITILHATVPETVPARVLERRGPMVELRLAARTAGSALPAGTLVRLDGRRGKDVLGRIERVSADGRASVSLIVPRRRGINERRLAPRYLPLTSACGYALLPGCEASVAVRVRLTDIGPTGFGFISPYALAPGTEVVVRATDEAGGRGEELAGRVVWVGEAADGWRVGVAKRL
jgi:hypothetical protein